MTEFFVLLNQILVLFILMGLGWYLTRTNHLTRATADQLTFLLCYVVTPCIVFYSFQRRYDPEKFHNLLLMLAVSCLIHLAFIVLGKLIFNARLIPEGYERAVLQFSIVYTNCGFMGFPLLDTILGADGVFYGSAYNAAFGLFLWTHGLLLYSRRFDLSASLRALVNPNIFAILLGVLFFAFSLSLPAPLMNSIHFLADLNSGLSMIVIGVLITSLPLSTLLQDRRVWAAVLLRNLLLPLGTVFFAAWCGFSGTLLLTIAIITACPTAGMAVLLATLNGRDTVFPSRIMIVSTILSLVTVPAIVLFAKTLAA